MKREISGNHPWRVILVGGGFGGLRAAQTLKSDLFDVTLIDRRNYHLYQPLLGQVASCSLSPGQISAPYDSASASVRTPPICGRGTCPQTHP
jgi:NADH dehydrogenase FAD-containing subunit